MARGPEQAVLDHIARVRPAPRRRKPALAGARADERRAPSAGISIGGAPWTADLDTVQILKERHILGRRVYVVSFEAEHLRAGHLPMTMVVRAERAPGLGWVARGISAGASVPEPELDAPRVLLGGSWGRFGFCGGGRVCGATPEIERVRLTFGNGIELEDDTENGWVLFFTDRPVERPAAIVDLLDAGGNVVASHQWPAGPELPDELRRRIPLVLTRRA
jgi:hypothetical protein